MIALADQIEARVAIRARRAGVRSMKPARLARAFKREL